MEALTIYDALLGELEPYSPSQLTIRKALSDADLTDATIDYVPTDHKKAVAKAAISVLKKMIVLSSESLGKSSQGYNVAMLEERIKEICKSNGLDVSEYVEAPSITDGSNMW